MTDDPGRLRVVAAGPHVTLQDGGRPGLLRFGVPRSGPMDRLAHAVANAAVDRDADATAIEISVAGLTVQCLDAPITVAIAGGSFHVDHPEVDATGWHVVTLDVGDRLAVRAGEWGSWCYLAAAGQMLGRRWLGHTATHAPSGFGGGRLRPGDEVPVLAARAFPERDGRLVTPDVARPGGVVPVVLGPQHRRLTSESVRTFLDVPWRLADAYDRMGVRLDGPALDLDGALGIPSEPIVRGAIQVAGDGVPTVLLADHQTVGGYPKVAVVPSSHVDRFVQLRPGDDVRFRAVSVAAAVAATREHSHAVDEALRSATTTTPNLGQRLRTTNLIAGFDDHRP